MIRKQEFYDSINQILNEGTIEGINIPNVDSIRYIINNEKINNKLYHEFCRNYNMMFENDVSMIQCKLQDMIYRIHLLDYHFADNHAIASQDDIVRYINSSLDLKNDDLFDAVSYDESDLEIVQDFFCEIDDFLAKRKI